MTAPHYTIEQYLNVHSATGPSFSPDGTKLSYLSDSTGVAEVWTLDLASGDTIQRTFHKEKVAFVQYTGRGDEMLFGVDAGGDERQQFHLIDDDGQERPLTADPSAIHAWGALTPDGGHLVYSANPGDPAHMHVHVCGSGQRRNPACCWTVRDGAMCVPALPTAAVSSSRIAVTACSTCSLSHPRSGDRALRSRTARMTARPGI